MVTKNMIINRIPSHLKNQILNTITLNYGPYQHIRVDIFIALVSFELNLHCISKIKNGAI